MRGFSRLTILTVLALCINGVYAAEPATQPSVTTINAPLPEGRYRIELHIGAAKEQNTIASTAEARRSIFPELTLPAGESAVLTRTIWRLSSQLSDGASIKLTHHDIGINTYDDALTLSFTHTAPCAITADIKPAGEKITNVFLAGDSTVTDQARPPWSAWGAMLPMYFDERVAVANLASSGRALRSFRAEKRLQKLCELLQPGDYVFIQFGHNDQKERGAGIGAFESYTDDLNDYIDQIQKRDGQPVLVTPVVRRRFDREGHFYDTLGDYPEAVRRVAKARNLPLIDLHRMSRELIESLGPERSKAIYLHVPAGTYPDQDEAIKDDTHFSEHGAREMAKLVVAGIRDQLPALVAHLETSHAPSTQTPSHQP